MPTNIEWTRGDDGSKGETWNPLVGCEYASEGCRGCYAAREAHGRLSHLPAYAGLTTKAAGEPPRFTGEVRARYDRLDQPLRWRRPRRIFVNSMSDLFHPGVLNLPGPDGSPFPFLAHAFAVMVAAEHHTFQVLTKRPRLMAAVMHAPRFRLDVNAVLLGLGHPVMPGGMTDPDFVWPANIWCGTSVETQRWADIRIPQLLDVPAAVRFLSAEPLLGPVDLSAWMGRSVEAFDGVEVVRHGTPASIDWVIVGGESGPQARPMHPDWARTLRDQCAAAGVPFFFKQWGEWAPGRPATTGSALRGNLTAQPSTFLDLDGAQHSSNDLTTFSLPDGWVRMARQGKKRAGKLLDGREWQESPR